MKIPEIELAGPRLLAIMHVKTETDSGLLLPGKEGKEKLQKATFEVILVSDDYTGKYKKGDMLSVSPNQINRILIKGEEYFFFFDNAVYFKYK